MSVMSPFDKLTWGDPFLAQFSGTDAQAYATDPTHEVLFNMTTGFEQAPSSVSNFVSGAHDIAQQSGTIVPQPVDPESGKPCTDSVSANPLTWPNWLGCTLSNIPIFPGVPANPQSPAGSSGKGSPSGKQFYGNPFNSFNGAIIALVVGALAVGLILLGAKSIMEV